MKYLLDTNICVYFLRGNHIISNHIRNIGWKNCYISEITVAELLIFDFARQKAILRKKGQLIEDSDLWIAASSIAYDMIMVTENVKHLGRLQNVRIEKWERQ